MAVLVWAGGARSVCAQERAAGGWTLDSWWEQDSLPDIDLRTIGTRDIMDLGRVLDTGAFGLNGLARYLPGISSRPFDGGEMSTPSLSMRGLPDPGLSQFLSISIDGVPAAPLTQASTGLPFLPLPLERIYAIDVIRGPYALRYSPNTMAGALNAVTLPIPRRPTFVGNFTVSENDYRTVSLGGGGTRGPWGLGFFFTDRNSDSYRDDAKLSNVDLNLKARRELGERSWAAFSLTYTDDQHSTPGGLTTAEYDAAPFANTRPNDRFQGDRMVGNLVFHQDLDDDVWWEAFGYFARTHRVSRAQRPVNGAGQEILDAHDDSWMAAAGARAEVSYELFGASHALHAEVRAGREWITDLKFRTEPFDGGEQVLNELSKYYLTTFAFEIDDTFEPVPDLAIVLALRFEWIPSLSSSGDIADWSYHDELFRVLPAAGASYAISKRWAVFADYTEGLRMPQITGWAFVPAGGSLSFETGRTAELGTRFRGPVGLNTSLVGWWAEYNDIADLEGGTLANRGKIRADGVDFTLDWQAGDVWPGLRGLSLGGSLTWQDSTIRSGPFTGNDTPYAWDTKAAWYLRYERGGWATQLAGTHVGASFSDEANTEASSPDGVVGRNPSRIVWDFRVSRWVALSQRGSLEFSLGANNLLDKRWYVHSDGGFFGGGKVVGAPRQAYFTVRVLLKW